VPENLCVGRQRCFDAKPEATAAELLPHERVPNTVIAHEVELERFPPGRTLEAEG
jgi:hypothetical protein